jgi:hypothetical protein
MKGSYADGTSQVSRGLNAVALHNAVLCAECDVVTDSPHDRCLVCGSRSGFNIAHMFGGNLPRNRAVLIPAEASERQRDIVLTFSPPQQNLWVDSGSGSRPSV